MEIRLSLNSMFECVYLVNGKLYESGEIVYGENHVVYVTVLPLDAVLLPYTVKLVGSIVKCNTDLASSYKLSGEKYYLKLKPRHNYVYSVPAVNKEPPKDFIERFFGYVCEKKVNLARECMSAELNESIDDASLTSFFNGFKDIIADERARGMYFIINDADEGVLYNFVLKNNLIDNIVEM